MTWIKFICWLSGLYAFYYAGNILWDVSRGKKVPGEESPELVYEAHTPEQVTAEEKAAPGAEKPLPPIIDSGGLRLRQLFAAAKAETIMYTGGVTY